MVGLLSERDLQLIETLQGVDPKRVTVEEAMSTSVYAVSPETRLDEVVTTMAEHKYGSPNAVAPSRRNSQASSRNDVSGRVDSACIWNSPGDFLAQSDRVQR